MNNTIIKTDHLRKAYGKNVILQDVSINIRQGEIYGIIGKNGSGKTTLLRIITGLINDFNGTIHIKKNNIATKISALISHPSLFLNMTALENMKVQATLLGNNNNEKIKECLEKVKLENTFNKLVKNFSLGMTQRLKLAMALLENPDVLILDEPVNGLDPDGIVELRNLLIDLNKKEGITILISSHILSELEQIATCYGILHNGKIVETTIENGKSIEQLYIQYTKGGI